MSATAIQVQAASRLHFGLFAFGRTASDERNYGGVGMMCAEPRLRIRFSPSDEFRVNGPLENRALAFATKWAQSVGRKLPNCKIAITEAPPEHAGFGLGTQLGLSIVAGLNAFFGLPAMDAEQLAQVAGRGKRSAVGVYGFLHGGFIVEEGKLPGETLSPLQQREVIPESWRIVLLRPSGCGLSGSTEQSTFLKLPPVDPQTSTRLREEVTYSMLPALEAADFDQFSHSVGAYSEMAGNCFAAAQGGPYNGPVLTEIVSAARELGAEGVGQSSWGPTIFCLLPDESGAELFVREVNHHLGHLHIESLITSPCNHGASIERQQNANQRSESMSRSLSPEA